MSDLGLTVDNLAQLIRIADPQHNLGAGALAEKILPWILAAQPATDESGLRERVLRLALQIKNMAHKAWLDPKNAEYLFTQIELRAIAIEANFAAARSTVQEKMNTFGNCAAQKPAEKEQS